MTGSAAFSGFRVGHAGGVGSTHSKTKRADSCESSLVVSVWIDNSTLGLWLVNYRHFSWSIVIGPQRSLGCAGNWGLVLYRVAWPPSAAEIRPTVPVLVSASSTQVSNGRYHRDSPLCQIICTRPLSLDTKRLLIKIIPDF